MYSSYSAAFALRTVKPSYNTHSSYLPSHHCHHFDVDSYQRNLLPVNPHLSPRFLLDGYLLRHSAHLLLLSARLRHSPPPHPPHCCRWREAACCYRRVGSGCGRPALRHVSCRLETSWHRCCGQGSGRSDLGFVCPQLKARGCGCGGSGSSCCGKLFLGNFFGRRDAPMLLGRALRQEVWGYEGGEWTHRRFSMECHGDCGEEEEDECGLAQLEVPVRPRLRRCEEEEDGDRCRDYRRRKCAEGDYQDDGEYYGQQRERRDVNGIHCMFRDSDRRRLDQRGCNDDDGDDTNMKRCTEMMEGRGMRDFEFDNAVAMRRFRAGRHCKDDGKYDQTGERHEFESEDVFDAGREGDGRYAEDDQRFDQRTERMDFEIDDDNYVRGEGRHHSNDDKIFLMQNSRRRQDREENISLLGSRHWHDQACDDDDDYQDNLDQKYYLWRTRRSALREDDSEKASTSKNIVDPRYATKGKNAASRVWWHDNIDLRAAQTSKARDRRYSSSVGWSNNENDKYDYNDARLVKVRDFRTGIQDVKVIIEDNTSLASSSKNTSILKHRRNIDHQVSARKEDSKKSSERMMDLSEVRHNNSELDSTTQSDHQEDGRNCIDNKSSTLQSSVKMANHSTRKIDQHDEVDQQMAGLTDTRTNSEKLTDVTIDSTYNVSRASLSQRNYDEVNQMDINDRSTSTENITHIVRDKERYANQQVIHESETDIDVQNVRDVDVSKVCASDVSMSRSSQDDSETRSDVNSIFRESLIDSARGQQEQIHQIMAMVSDSAMVKGPHSNLGTGVYGRVHSASVTNIVGCTKDTKDQVELTKARDTAAMASTSERLNQTRVDDQFQSSSSVDTAGSLNAQIDLLVAVSSSHNSSNNQARRTLAINPVGKVRNSRDKIGQQMKQGSSIERNDQARTIISQSFDESREVLTRAKETRRLMQHNMALNWQEAGTSRISDDKDITSLEMASSEEGSIVDAVVEQRGVLFGRSETTAGRSIPGGITTRKPVNESLLESAARLEKSSTLHAGQFVAELQKGVSNAYTTLTEKDGKSIMEDFATSSSRSRMKGPSDEMWDVQSATSLETFKTADMEEEFLADGGTNSASHTPKNGTTLARKVHKSLYSYVRDIVRLGWIQRGESHDSSNKSVKKSSSTNSQSTKGWLSSQGHDSDDTQKKGGSAKPKDGQLMKSHGGESESRIASMPKDESLPTGTKSLQISEASNVPKVGRSKGDFVARVSKNDVLTSGERAKLSEAGASPKGNIIRGLVEDSTTTLIDVSTRHSPEHDAITPSSIVTKGSAEINTGKGTEEAGWDIDAGNWTYGPSVAITPYNHPQAQAMMPHENASSSFLKSPELPAGGSMRLEENIVVQGAPEVMRTDRKDAELNRRKIQRNKQVLKETFDDWEEASQHDAKQRKTDEFFMKEALREAQRGADMWEVPVGAVLVHNGEIIARGCNLVEDLRDSTAHAEIVCIREASNKLKTWRLADATLYVTLEPCAMCAGAILQARVDTVVWGAPNKLLGADGSWVRLFPRDGQTSTLHPENQNQTSGPVHPFHPKIIIRRGVLPMECSEIMQQFFQLRRKKKQKPESPPRALLPGHHHHPIKFFTKMHHMFGSIFCL